MVFQVRECATALLHIAKKHDIPIFLVGHVTKSGDIAGPKVLEHIVDVVLYMEGEKHQSFRWGCHLHQSSESAQWFQLQLN